MIEILLATYNGAEYIREQLESLFLQTCQDFFLYVQDDCSTDETYSILQEYAQRFPQRIDLSATAANSGNAKYNFIDMMIKHKADYIMLCDQDDVWLPDKIDTTLSKMKEAEQILGSTTPLLVHTDLRVVDENLQTISPSFKKMIHIDFSRTGLPNQIVQNTLTGCTAMYNRALAELINEPPTFTTMHDSWVMMIASAFGYVFSIDEPPILYRQHAKNNIGAKDVATLRYKLDRLVNGKKAKSAIAGTYLQAQSFLSMYREKLTDKQIRLLENYCGIPDLPKLKRMRMILKLGTFKHGFTRNIAYFLFI